ncbi:PREDICTED: uncharacterized protein LOC108568834 [Nicrophorus vespilloides]|uniref:Uncharacterized protein LOC108568834 n=1 Tax=Nicrophorus vespilloides TaxID=110193 RepID=A0ABM1NFM4_NICVS|nr:PREDICTED: uncharacterized protein LOC108568834 [Nicrophorus vespilloides]
MSSEFSSTKLYLSHSSLSVYINIFHNSNLERNHLLTKQDLTNIKNGYRIRNESDTPSLDVWLNEMDNCCYIPIYKPKNEYSTEFPFLKKEDFVLVLINKWQLQQLMDYESNFICVDSTPGLNDDGLQLHTLSVLKDSEKGFPCAFLISNRTDEQILCLFYSGVRECCVCKIRTQVFMSDIADYYYDAWVQVMYPAELRLFSIWQVDQDWINHLNKINSREKQIDVYGKLRILLYETEKNTFETMIQQFVQSLLEDKATLNFARYFQVNYFHKVSVWALCYRLNYDKDTQLHLERMHRTIKYLFLDNKYLKRFHMFFNATLTYIKDKLFDPTIMSDPMVVWSKTASMKNKHIASMSLDLSSVMVTQWGGFNVYDMNHIYAVQKNNDLCSCTVICSECEVCMHAYSCTCIDYAVKWKMCKHIHLALRYKKTYPKLCARVEEKHSADNYEDESEETTTTDSIAKRPQDTTVQARVNEMKMIFEDAIKKINSHNMCDALAKILAPIHPTLDTIKMLE